MNLKHLTDSALLKDTKLLVKDERKLTTEILHHLKEIDHRRLYSDIKYGSLFEYCVKELGYSESGATRRIAEARLLEEVPEIETKINSGLLNLTTISTAAQFFRNNEVSAKVERLSVLNELSGLTKRESEKKLFEISDVKLPSRENQKRLSADKVKLSVILSDETLECLEEVRNLLNKKLSYDELIFIISKDSYEFRTREKYKILKSLDSQPPVNVNLKTIPNQIKRTVFSRDKSCTNCGSTHRLNFDHRTPKALGGNNSSENIRLLCFSCNQRARIRAKL